MTNTELVANSNLLVLTPLAQTAVKDYLETEKMDGQTAGVRISVMPGGCSGFKYSLLVEDKPADDDIIEKHGEVRAFIDPFSAQYLEGVEIDYVVSMQASGFKFTNPKATGGCGCGSSFSA